MIGIILAFLASLWHHKLFIGQLVIIAILIKMTLFIDKD